MDQAEHLSELELLKALRDLLVRAGKGDAIADAQAISRIKSERQLPEGTPRRELTRKFVGENIPTLQGRIGRSVFGGVGEMATNAFGSTNANQLQFGRNLQDSLDPDAGKLARAVTGAIDVGSTLVPVGGAILKAPQIARAVGGLLPRVLPGGAKTAARQAAKKTVTKQVEKQAAKPVKKPPRKTEFERFQQDRLVRDAERGRKVFESRLKRSGELLRTRQKLQDAGVKFGPKGRPQQPNGRGVLPKLPRGSRMRDFEELQKMLPELRREFPDLVKKILRGPLKK